MAPVQQTFSLIPELPSALNGGEQAGKISRPPMTTKQAKKAYKAKNKGPKLSKAEQRRLDLMEQDRIRRESEKERNQARAKAARDKRKEKEEKEKAAKKKKGLPLVDVHPSQDTLARFVRKPKTPTPQLTRQGEVSKSRAPSNEPNEEPIPTPVLDCKAYDSDRSVPVGDEAERPTKRQCRVDNSPNVLEDRENVPNGMFKKPTAKREIETKDVAGTPPVGAGIDTEGDPVPNINSFVPDEPSSEELVNQQILSESFSADDGLFDDIDIDAIVMEPIVHELAQVKTDMPPPKPPDPSISSKEQKGTAQSYQSFEQRISKSRSNHDIPTRGPPRVMGSRQFPERHESHLGPLLKDKEKPKTKGNTAQHIIPDQTAQSQETINNFTRANTNNRSFSGTNTTKYAHGSFVVERRDSNLLHEVPPNRSDSVKPSSTLRNIVNKVHAEEEEFDKAPRPTFAKHQASFLRPDSFQPPQTPIMGPPPIPPKFKTPLLTSKGSMIEKPRFLRQQTLPNVNQSDEQQCSIGNDGTSTPPLSTQFLLNNLDDLFPSPSQEVAEIFERPIDGGLCTSTRPKTAPLPPSRFISPLHSGRPKTANNVGHRILSKSYLQPACSSTKYQGSLRVTPESTRVTSIRPPAAAAAAAAANIDFVSFLSTQDISLSTEDLLELGDEAGSSANTLETSQVTAPLGVQANASKCSFKANTNQKFDNPSTPFEKLRTTSPLGATDADIRLEIPTMAARSPGSNCQSQHSSSLPETPSGSYPRKNQVTRDGTQIATNIGHRALREQDDTAPLFFITDDEIAEILDEELGNESGIAENEDTKKSTSIVDRQTPVGIRPSPKPFFTSSGTKEKVYLAIERTKNTAWKDIDAQRQAHQDLDVLLRQEDEKQERMLLNKMLEEEEEESAEASQPDSVRHQTGNCSQDASRNETGNTMLHDLRSSGQNKAARRRSQPQSSFEKMLAMLEKSKNEHNTVCASQESDYGDFAWDDDLINV